MVGTAHGTYYYPIPTTEREGLMDHDFSDLDESNKNYVAPTCYSEGIGVYWCSICGLKNEMRPIKRLDHNYGPEYTVPATCMDKGAIMRECQNVGCKEAYDANPVDNASHYLVVKELDIDSNAHKWKLSPINEDADPGTAGHDVEAGSATRLPTCTKNGINAYVCEYNNAHRKAEKVPALGHDEQVIPAIKPTCTEVGYTAGVVCMREGCDGKAAALPEGYPEANLPDGYVKVIVAPEVVPAKGHTVLDIITKDSATCTTPGQITYKCAVCGKEVTEDTVALGHDWFRVEDDDTPADCINGGYASFRCANCGEEKREEIPATGEHQFGEWIEEPATCKTAGRIYRVCDVCGYEDVQEFLPVDPDAHEWEIDWDNVKKYPSCTEAGIGAMKCNICGVSKYGRIEPTGHNPIEIPAVEPTCTENGMTAGSVCEWCGETLEESEVIEALGHDWEEVSVEGATCVKPGKATYVCTRCGEVDTEEGILGDHTLIRWKALDKAPSCVSAAAEAYVCYYCDYVEYRANGKPDPTGHVWVKLEQISVPTCVSGALDLYACYFCDARVIKESETSKADPSNHVWCDVGDKMACYYCDATKAK
jgi:DNA-directed RNA polymerase subunit RPC12/RpoP